MRKNWPYLLVLLLCIYASLVASGIAPALIPNSVNAVNKRGTSNVFQLAANNSAAAAGSEFCDDGSGNVTTVGCGAGGTTPAISNVTPVTAQANSTAAQPLMEMTLPAGYLNTLAAPFLVHGSGNLTIAVAQTPTLTFAAKLCVNSGCGSGTALPLYSSTTAATIAATNNTWSMNLKLATTVTGASGKVIVHGPLAVDIGATPGTAAIVYNDQNAAQTSAIDLTAALFIDFFVTTSTGSTGNIIIQQIGTVEPASSAGPAGPAGAAGPPGTGGSYVLVEEHSASNSASLAFTTCITSTYDNYQIQFLQIVPATDATKIGIQVSTNGGSTYDSTSGHYNYIFLIFIPSASATGGGADTAMWLENGQSNGGTTSYNGTATFYAPGSSAKQHLVSQGTGWDTGSTRFLGWQSADVYNQAVAINAFQVLASAGNLTSGTVRCYGIAK